MLPRPVHLLESIRLALFAGAAIAPTLAGPAYAAAEANSPAETPQREQLTIAPEEVMKPWTGDLDGMIARRFIRVLTVHSKTFYFVDHGY